MKFKSICTMTMIPGSDVITKLQCYSQTVIRVHSCHSSSCGVLFSHYASFPPQGPDHQLGLCHCSGPTRVLWFPNLQHSRPISPTPHPRLVSRCPTLGRRRFLQVPHLHHPQQRHIPVPHAFSPTYVYGTSCTAQGRSPIQECWRGHRSNRSHDGSWGR